MASALRADPIRELEGVSLELVEAIGSGLTYPEIAAELGLSKRTVENYTHKLADVFTDDGDGHARPEGKQRKKLTPYLKIFRWVAMLEGELGPLTLEDLQRESIQAPIRHRLIQRAIDARSKHTL